MRPRKARHLPRVTQLRVQLGLEPGQLASGVCMVSLWAKWKGQYGGYTGMDSTKVDRPTSSSLDLQPAESERRRMCIPATTVPQLRWGWGMMVVAGPDSVDMCIQGTNREPKELKVFVAVKIQRQGQHPSLLSPPLPLVLSTKIWNELLK